MKLSYWELDWVHTRMKNYDIKYVEIYNELFDHITTAIEHHREAGDTGTVQLLYEQVIQKQFGGFYGIEDVAKSYEKAYKNKIRKLIWANYRHYLNFQSLLFTAVLISLSCIMPQNKLTAIVFTVAIFVAAMYPCAYAYITLKRIKPPKGEISLIYSYVITQANFPPLFLYLVIWLPQIPELFNDKYHFKLVNVHPAIMAFLLALILIYDFSCMRLCKQELKSFKN